MMEPTGAVLLPAGVAIAFKSRCFRLNQSPG
jgi:hypothetical protein